MVEFVGFDEYGKDPEVGTEGNVQEAAEEEWDLTRLGVFYFAPAFGAVLVAALLLCALHSFTLHRRKRRQALARRRIWSLGVDALKGEVRDQLLVQGVFVGAAAYSEAIVLDGEWFEFGGASDRSCLCCGARWGDDLARVGLSWAEMHAREPDVTRDRSASGSP